MSSSARILQLPLEIRELIYDLLYWPPYDTCSSRFDPKLLGEDPSSPKRLYYKCSRFSCHFNLTLVCRQIYQEYFPICARRHIFHVPHLHELVNDYAPFVNPQRFASLHHLRINSHLSWNGDICRRSSGKPYHDVKAYRYRFATDLHRFIAMREAFQYFAENFKTLNFKIYVPRKEDLLSVKSSECGASIRNILLLLERTGEICDMSERGRRFFIVEARGFSGSFGLFTIKIWAVPKETWTAIPEGVLPKLQRHHVCTGSYPGCHYFSIGDSFAHEEYWTHPSELVTARQPLPCADEGVPVTVFTDSKSENLSARKNWKVVIRPSRQYDIFMDPLYDLSLYWDAALSSLDKERVIAQKAICRFEKEFARNKKSDDREQKQWDNLKIVRGETRQYTKRSAGVFERATRKLYRLLFQKHAKE